MFIIIVFIFQSIHKAIAKSTKHSQQIARYSSNRRFASDSKGTKQQPGSLAYKPRSTRKHNRTLDKSESVTKTYAITCRDLQPKYLAQYGEFTNVISTDRTYPQTMKMGELAIGRKKKIK